ncbi:MAG TPA: hydroxymethylbilane synthase [Candidatus Eisenbacteria bacterium]|nr:hydroxymethylbilane synthase [Candidatus Eisenbacteria bacterium]
MSHIVSIKLGVSPSRLGRCLGERIAEQARGHLAGPVAFAPIAEEVDPSGAVLGWPGSSLERALARGQVDAVVVSVKDISPDLDPALAIAAVTERFTPFDVFIGRDDTILDELPDGAELSAHTSIRRAQLLRYREDFQLLDVPGSLDDRMRILDAGGLDGIVVSASAVEHLGHQDRVNEIFTTEMILPAPGQGACAVLTRTDDKERLKLFRHLDHPIARAEVECERSFLRELKAEPGTAVGALASFDGTSIRLEGAVADEAGKRFVRDAEEGESGEEVAIGARLARRLLLEGARRILAAAADR